MRKRALVSMSRVHRSRISGLNGVELVACRPVTWRLPVVLSALLTASDVDRLKVRLHFGLVVIVLLAGLMDLVRVPGHEVLFSRLKTSDVVVATWRRHGSVGVVLVEAVAHDLLSRHLVRALVGVVLVHACEDLATTSSKWGTRPFPRI